MAWKTAGNNVADGCMPNEFDGCRGFIIGANGQTFEIEITVVENSEDFQDFNVAGVNYSALSQRAGLHVHHAMFRQCTRLSEVDGKLVKQHILRNSWGTCEDFHVLEHGSSIFLATYMCSIRNLVWKGWKASSRDDQALCENLT